MFFFSFLYLFSWPVFFGGRQEDEEGTNNQDVGTGVIVTTESLMSIFFCYYYLLKPLQFIHHDVWKITTGLNVVQTVKLSSSYVHMSLTCSLTVLWHGLIPFLLLHLYVLFDTALVFWISALSFFFFIFYICCTKMLSSYLFLHCVLFSGGISKTFRQWSKQNNMW